MSRTPATDWYQDDRPELEMSTRAVMNITEADYDVLVGACLDARDAGDMEAANALNAICRRANGALSKSKYSKLKYATGGRGFSDFKATGPLDE